MHSNETIQSLIQARLEGVRQASEKRDVDELMSWHSKDATFTDVVNNITQEGIEAVRAFYAQAYQAIPTFRISDTRITGYTPDFVAGEMKCEGEAAVDLPHMGLKAGETLRMTGVSLFWYQWEGPGEEWDGSLDEKSVRGWKIIRERAYYVPTKASE